MAEFMKWIIPLLIIGAAAADELQKEIEDIQNDQQNDGDECQQYKELVHADRATTNSDQSNVKCDRKAPNEIGGGWYRIVAAGSGQLPEKCVPTHRCGTKAPGWLNGKHPSVQEGIVTREVCYHWSGNCCKWKNNIRIRNCGRYFVYELQKPPTCDLRYCFKGDECRRYKILDQSDRAMSFADSSTVKCDGKEHISSPGWFRMMGNAGRKIPEKCVPTQRCGTKAPGWLNGKHPTVQEGVVTREVCYHWSDNCCKWKNKIKIRNCGGYFVYELQKPPTCDLRYCGDKEIELGSECESYNILDQPDRSVSNTDKSNIRCDKKAPYDIKYGWYRMVGKGGVEIPEKTPPTERCGTKATGWLNGKHPTVQEGIVTREVCYHWSSNNCKWKNNIRIRNCGGYYVYQLQKPQTCDLRYCTDKKDPFTTFDKNGDGFASKSEIGDGKWKVFSDYDLNSDQKISRDEFDILLKVSQDIKETNYLNHFRAADSNHDGYVTVAEMQQRFAQLGKDASLSSVRSFIRGSDQNNDAKLNYNEFKKAFFKV
ncbi:uncharacterized protein LOC144665700 [Oculina patagonica]